MRIEILTPDAAQPHPDRYGHDGLYMSMERREPVTLKVRAGGRVEHRSFLVVAISLAESDKKDSPKRILALKPYGQQDADFCGIPFGSTLEGVVYDVGGGTGAWEPEPPEEAKP